MSNDEKNIYDEALWHWSAVTANLAYASIDMALWDIYGKQVNKPIYQLLGGSLRDEVSYFYYLTWTDINDLIKQCEDWVNKGYDIFYLKNTANGMEMTYAIVSESEADLAAKKISASSPIGKGLLGKKVGEIAEIKVPNGIMKFEIVDISR